MRLWDDLLAAFGFLTRLPTPKYAFDSQTIARSAKFFPLVGLVVAALPYALYDLLAGHANVNVQCAAVLTGLMLITGGFHEEGLTDVADGFGGGRTRERILEIMHDSRIGGYGAIALALSLLVRFALLTSLTPGRFWPYLASAHILSRWSALPLAVLLPPARHSNGKGALIAGRISRQSLIVGTLIALALCIYLLHVSFVMPLLASIAVVFLSAAYYRRHIGGVTGDCFGATNQLVEIAVYFCGAWI